MIDQTSLEKWVANLASVLANNEDPSSKQYNYFLQEPELALELIDLINNLQELQVYDEDRAYYSASVFALEICVSQLQVLIENGSKLAAKTLNQLMSKLAVAIKTTKHTLSFWLPILNAFYEVHIELSEELKDAYLNLANDEEDVPFEGDFEHLNSIRDLILDLADLSVFDITENFFAQSYAMPADFFADLVLDLYSIDEGKDIAVLTLLHPKQDVRDIVVAVHEQIMDKITLSAASLSRLKTIKEWYPSAYHSQFDAWIKLQRRKGVVFKASQEPPKVWIKASEIDGGGAQGIFIHLQRKRQHRLCGLLFKQTIGIKDAWMTPIVTSKDIHRYYDEALDESVMLRNVDVQYLESMINHFLTLTLQQGGMPDLHLLEIQEELGLNLFPQLLDITHLMEQLSIQISPFTPDNLQVSLKRSKTWPNNKRFTESWYVENAHIDKLVNRCCSYIDGVKVCRFKEAMNDVFINEFEKYRERWLFHFLWMALWMKAKTRKNEKIWQDCFLIAYAIHNGMALQAIPIMQEICHQSVVNSIETMQERRTHLNRQ